MKVAAITPSFNEEFQLEQWIEFYNQYKKELFLHIIVDNGSTESYKEKLQKSFSSSVIIARELNGGSTAAFNDGIRYAIQHNADSILLITQDVQLENGAVTKLYNTLFSSSDIGIVGPVLLMGGTEDIVEEYGGRIDFEHMEVIKNYAKHRLDDALPDEMEVDFIAGGINLAKVETYKKVGLQDESLFMYWDETDWDIRCKRMELKLKVSKAAKSWHQHIYLNKSAVRSPMAVYLLSRNKFILKNKYAPKDKLRLLLVHLFNVYPRMSYHLLKKGNVSQVLALYKGAIVGYFK